MTQLVGILNITPDSFSDGGQYLELDEAINRAAQLFQDGASIVDVGAESTRPGATILTPEQEWMRLEPVLTKLIALYPNKISVDTYHPETTERVLRLGDVIINDVTGMNNPEMIEVVLNNHARIIISHLPGKDIQAAHSGELIDDVERIKRELLQKATYLESKGLEHEKIILDPGIGFGKTKGLNHKLLKFAELIPEYPVMIGYSRKRFLGEDRMEIEPNIEAGKIAVDSGASYLRVHDVENHAVLVKK